jgi:Tfp pilus assembly major pilin PilA
MKSLRQLRPLGLTLIEFMIILAVGGVLAALAIPQLQSALVRGRVAEGLNTAEDAKAQITRNALMGASDLGAGFKAPASTRLVKSMTVTSASTGEIEVRYGQEGGGGTLVLVPHTGPASAPVSLVAGKPVANGAVAWACKGQGSLFPLGSAGTTLPEFVPEQCR